VAGSDPDGTPAPPADDSVDVPTSTAAAIELDKQADALEDAAGLLLAGRRRRA